MLHFSTENASPKRTCGGEMISSCSNHSQIILESCSDRPPLFVTLHAISTSVAFFWARSCLGKSRAVRPSVSNTKMKMVGISFG